MTYTFEIYRRTAGAGAFSPFTRCEGANCTDAIVHCLRQRPSELEEGDELIATSPGQQALVVRVALAQPQPKTWVAV